MIGYQAGYYETGSNKLFIDNANRTSEANARVTALVYGIFNAAVASQSLLVNGELKSSYGAKFGDGGTTNYTQFGTNGDLSFQGSAGFYPVRIAQAAQPSPDTGELVIWRDTDDGKVYLVYNDTDSGVKQIEMV